ncbi:hypothetical protein [Kitasatospora cineracea]|uniref:hypothetical protein n=1 Tax=Kitasatospora cineracea TaxID=88074 RepID=UPI0036C2E431
MKYAIVNGAVRWSGGLQVLRTGQSIEDDHPLALERPELFTGDQPGPDIKKPGRHRGGPVVETATRAPGEQRATKAPAAGKGKSSG